MNDERSSSAGEEIEYISNQLRQNGCLWLEFYQANLVITKNSCPEIRKTGNLFEDLLIAGGALIGQM